MKIFTIVGFVVSFIINPASASGIALEGFDDLNPMYYQGVTYHKVGTDETESFSCSPTAKVALVSGFAFISSGTVYLLANLPNETVYSYALLGIGCISGITAITAASHYLLKSMNLKESKIKPLQV